jgi:hypothetical protein
MPPFRLRILGCGLRIGKSEAQETAELHLQLPMLRKRVALNGMPDVELAIRHPALRSM